MALEGKRVQQRVRDLTAAVALHEKASQVLTSIGEEQQEYAQHQIEELVTRGLQLVFDESLSFHLVQSVKANQANVDFVVRTSIKSPKGDFDSSVEVFETSVMEARGGGLAAVVGFMLRLVVLLLTPEARRLLVLDESFAHVSEDYEPRLAEFLREVADKAGVQIVLVTHSRAYDDVADKQYRLQLGRGGHTEAKEL